MRHTYADSFFQDCPDQNIDAMWAAYADSCRIEELESENAKLREMALYILHQHTMRELSAGTCHADETDTIKCWIKCKDEPSTEHIEIIHVMECSVCGGTYEYINGNYEFCPRCSRKVVDE